MIFSDIFRKITNLFKKKDKKKDDEKKKDYSIRTADVRFSDIPKSVYLVIKKYGWLAFFQKTAIILKKYPYGNKFTHFKGRTKGFFQIYIKKISNLSGEALNSLKQEGFKRMVSRAINYILHGKGVLNKKEIENRKRYSEATTVHGGAARKFSPIFSSSKIVYYVSNIPEGGAKKYINDLIDVFETTRLNFVEIKNREDLNVHEKFFKKDDILIFQYLFFTDISFEDVIKAKKDYGIKLVIPIHDFYFLQKHKSDFHRCHNGIYYSFSNKSIKPTVFELLKLADLIIYPSKYVKDVFDNIFVFDKAKLSGHIDHKERDYLDIPKVEKTINLGIINNISVYKGADYYPKLFSIKKYKGYDIRYHVFGMNETGPPDVIFHGSYIEEEIFSLLKKNNIHGLVFLNKWGETYSYSLTKGINSGLPILYSNMGAYQERLEDKQKYFPIHDNNDIAIDLHKMLEMIIEKQGATDRKQKINQFERIVPDLYKNLFKQKTDCKCLKMKNTKVSVVVPNYNYEKYLKERLQSIVDQTYKPFEIIFLDDKSTDESVDLAEEFLSKTPIPYRIIKNESNVGCFRQWARGVREARGELIWIAEADDSCEPNFLEVLVKKFSDPEVGLACAQSIRIDENGKKEETYLSYLETIPAAENRWRQDYVNNGLNEIRNYLVIKNTIVNASAVVMRRDLLLELGDEIGGGLRQAGDWYTYVKILEKSKIAFSAAPLNYHRFHRNNIVSRSGRNSIEKGKQLVSESLQVQNFILSRFSVSDRRSFLAWEHTKLVCRNNLGKEIDDFPEYAKETEIFKKDEKFLRKKILFFSTNDGWGGSEISCAKIAKAFSKKDFSVALCMKKHDPRPEILKKIIEENRISLLERSGMADYCHSDAVRKFVKSHSPDLVFISQGHVFEGREMMKWCQEKGFDYVNFIPLITMEHLQIIGPDEKSVIESERYFQLSKMIFLDNWPARKVMEKIFDSKFKYFSVIRNAFDVPYRQSPTWPKKSDGFYKLMYIGRLYYIHKGLDMLLEVLAMNKWKERPLQIKAYGEGVDRKKMEEYIEKNEIKNFFFCGYTEDLANEIIKYHGVIFPSRMEGTPLALIDGLLCYRMGIVTPVGGMTEFVVSGQTGFVAIEPSVKALDECLEKAWQRKEKWRALGEEAGAEVRKLVPEFPEQQCIDVIDKILG